MNLKIGFYMFEYKMPAYLTNIPHDPKSTLPDVKTYKIETYWKKKYIKMELIMFLILWFSISFITREGTFSTFAKALKFYDFLLTYEAIFLFNLRKNTPVYHNRTNKDLHVCKNGK